ncbi:MAG: prepilin-type N-terminal cleavage/methylation domain-containing protein [Candidatus Baltobacteraceae bacterium]
MRERGFTLLETMIAAAVAAALLLAAIPLALGSRPAAAVTSALAFDAITQRAASLAASSGNGATLVIASSTNGYRMQLYAGRPTQADAMIADMPALVSGADIREAVLGGPPLTLFFDSGAHASGMRGAVDGTAALETDPGCPAGETVLHFSFTDGRSPQTRSLACVQTVSSP